MEQDWQTPLHMSLRRQSRIMQPEQRHIALLCLLNFCAIPHGATGGDSSPVPSSPTQPVHSLASTTKIAPAPISQPPVMAGMPAGVDLDTIKAALQGQAWACHELGRAWAEHRDPRRAARWFRLAAEQGFAPSQGNLASLYEHDRVAPDAEPWSGAVLLLPDGRRVARENASFFDLHLLLNTQWADAVAHAQHGRIEAIQAQRVRLLGDLSEAIHWYTLAAAQGDASSQYNLGRIYMKLAQSQRHLPVVPSPLAPTDSPSAARRLPALSTAAAQGDALAQYELGQLHFFGLGTPQDDAAAAQNWHDAALQGHRRAQHNLAYLLGSRRTTARPTGGAAHWYQELAYHYLKLAADQLVRDAQLALGHMHLDLAADMGRQRQYLSQLPQPTNTAGLRLLPRDNPDYLAARHWFGLAAQPFPHTVSEAEARSPAAKLWSGIAARYDMPESWVYVANPGLALQPLAAGRNIQIPGIPEAMLVLGRLNYEGAGAAPNPVVGAQWLRQAERFDTAESQYNLAFAAQHGEGVPQDLFAAWQGYTAAARQGSGRAQYNLGTLYYQSKRLGFRTVLAATPPLPPESTLRQALEQANPQLAGCLLDWVQWAGQPFLQITTAKDHRHAIAAALPALEGARMVPVPALAERVRLRFDPAHRVERWRLLNELQLVDARLLRGSITQYVEDGFGKQWLEICTEDGLAIPTVDRLQKAFPHARFEWLGGVQYLRDPLVDDYPLVALQRKDANREAYRWWSAANKRGQADARYGLALLERVMSPSSRDEAAQRALADGDAAQQSQPDRVKTRLTQVPQAPGTKAWAAGYFITSDGYLITSQDVMAMGRQLRVQTETGTFAARVVDANASPNGYTLLKVDGHQFHPLPLALSENIAEGDDAFVLGHKQLHGSHGVPTPCSILTQIASDLGNQADPRYFTLSSPVLGDRLYLRFNKYVDKAQTPNPPPPAVLASAERESLARVRQALMDQTENLARAPHLGYLLHAPLWLDPHSGEWHAQAPEKDTMEVFHPGQFIQVDGRHILKPPPLTHVDGGRQILCLVTPTGMAEPAEAALRERFWQAGFERLQYQPGMRGMALLNRHGQAVALHFPPLHNVSTHDYPNFNTYDQFTLKADALIKDLRARAGLRLDETRPQHAPYALRLASRRDAAPAALSGLLAHRPDAWLPPSARYLHGTHTAHDPVVRSSLHACDMALACVESPMISRARPSLALVQIAP